MLESLSSIIFIVTIERTRDRKLLSAGINKEKGYIILNIGFGNSPSDE